MRRPQLALRDLFWLVLIAALAIAWQQEHQREREFIQRGPKIEPFSQWFELVPDSSDSWSPSESETMVQEASAFAGASDEELVELFESDSELRGVNEPLLCELARRRLAEPLRRHYGRGPPGTDLILLTALRRAEGKPDPLRITATMITAWPDGTSETGPVLLATLRNDDVGGEAVEYKHGGDDRGGRRARWRIHLYDAAGNRVRDARFLSRGGGGIITVGSMARGEEYRFELDARSYVSPPPEGEYTLELVHANDGISHRSDLTGRIVFRSEPIKVRVRRPAKGSRYSLGPLVALAAIGMVVSGVRCVQSLRRGEARAWRRHFPLSRLRDWAAVAVIIGLGVAWHFDSRHLAAEAEKLNLDRSADWTMEIMSG
jgi:hypothetical protein